MFYKNLSVLTIKVYYLIRDLDMTVMLIAQLIRLLPFYKYESAVGSQVEGVNSVYLSPYRPTDIEGLENVQTHTTNKSFI